MLTDLILVRFGLIAEMRRPQDFTKALIACQTVMVALYLVSAFALIPTESNG